MTDRNRAVILNRGDASPEIIDLSVKAAKVFSDALDVYVSVKIIGKQVIFEILESYGAPDDGSR